jgi:hypothetical protein
VREIQISKEDDGELIQSFLVSGEKYPEYKGGLIRLSKTGIATYNADDQLVSMFKNVPVRKAIYLEGTFLYMLIKK